MDNRRLLIAALLSLIVVVGWQALIGPSEPPPAASRETAPPPATPGVESEYIAPAQAPSLVSEEPLLEAPVEAMVEREVTLETDRVVARFTNRGGQLLSFRLKQNLGPGGEYLELIRPRASTDPYPFALVSLSGEPLPVNKVLYEVEERAAEGGGRAVTFLYRGAAGEVRKRFVVGPMSPFFETRVEVRGVGVPWGIFQGPDVRLVSTKALGSSISTARAAASLAISRRSREVSGAITTSQAAALRSSGSTIADWINATACSIRVSRDS